jgi:hypothetical protein
MDCALDCNRPMNGEKLKHLLSRILHRAIQTGHFVATKMTSFSLRKARKSGEGYLDTVFFISSMGSANLEFADESLAAIAHVRRSRQNFRNCVPFRNWDERPRSHRTEWMAGHNVPGSSTWW